MQAAAPALELGTKTASAAFQLVASGGALLLFADFHSWYGAARASARPDALHALGINALAAYWIICLAMTRWLNRRELFLRL